MRLERGRAAGSPGAFALDLDRCALRDVQLGSERHGPAAGRIPRAGAGIDRGGDRDGAADRRGEGIGDVEFAAIAGDVAVRVSAEVDRAPERRRTPDRVEATLDAASDRERAAVSPALGGLEVDVRRRDQVAAYSEIDLAGIEITAAPVDLPAHGEVRGGVDRQHAAGAGSLAVDVDLARAPDRDGHAHQSHRATVA